MQIKTIAKGLVVGSVVGTACYMIVGSTPKQRKHLKKTISRTVRSFGNMCNDFSYIM